MAELQGVTGCTLEFVCAKCGALVTVTTGGRNHYCEGDCPACHAGWCVRFEVWPQARPERKPRSAAELTDAYRRGVAAMGG